jgi:hypothetical protein
MIALTNNMGENNFREEGDLDFFIVTAKDRIWTTRFFMNSLLEILGLRPKKNNKKDKICSGFFITEDNLNLQSIALRPYDIYLIYWIHFLIPLYDREKIYEKFLKTNNWTREFLPNIYLEHRKAQKRTQKNTEKLVPNEEKGLCVLLFNLCSFVSNLSHRNFNNFRVNPRRIPRRSASIDRSGKARMITRINAEGKCRRFNLFEKFFRWIQLKIMPKILKQRAKTDPQAVIISDKMLKFHEGEKRQKYQEKWKERLKKFLISKKNFQLSIFNFQKISNFQFLN